MTFDITNYALIKHPIFSQVDVIKDFIRQYQHLGFNHFSYLRLIDHHQRILLTSNPSLSDAIVNNQLYKIAFYGPPEVYSEGLFLIDHLNLGKIRTAMSENNIQIGFLIIKERPHFKELFFWGSSENNPSLYHFVINNLNTFENLCDNFIDYASPMLKQYELIPLFYPEGKETSGLADQKLKLTINKNLFSHREHEILNHLKKGLSSKRIAYTIGGSYRTIDKHIENMLLKTNSHSRLELLSKTA